MKKLLLLLLNISILSWNNYSQNNGYNAKLLDSVINSFHKNKLFNGFVLIAKKDSIIFQKGYGYSNMEDLLPFTSNTKIKIGSVSKQFTAYMILRLTENGEIDLNKTISDYFDYPFLKQFGKVTIRQLLVMSSGIPDVDIPQDALKEYHHATYYLSFLSKESLIYEPGTSYNYSNPNYDILGLLVEKITGLTLEEAYKKIIFDKIGIHDTGLNFLPDTITYKARSYNISLSGYERSYEENLYLVRGCGSLYSTASDLLKWDNSLLKKENLSEDTYKNYFHPYCKMNSNTYYSNGWIIEYFILNGKDSIKIARHEGSAPTYFNCINYIDLTNGYIVVILDNTIYSFRREVLAQIQNVLYHQPIQYAKRSLYFETAEMIKKMGFDATINYLLKMDLFNNPYQWGRYDIDYLKGLYRKDGKIKEFLELQRVCTYLYPDFKEFSGWAMDNYKKRIKMNPEDGKLFAYLGAYQLFDGQMEDAKVNLKKALYIGIPDEYVDYIKKLIKECK